MQTADIRSKFIEFFKKYEHTHLPSASTIPTGDKTILFTVAGMTQFKAYFTGEAHRTFTRAVNSQKCIRVADLDEVGKNGRHLTMFEMLGSWSFGDYYKQEAISWSYEFITNVLKLDLSRIWISVHHTDEESIALWHSNGVPSERIIKLGDKDNFWAMGPTGPCGPCTEAYYDQGLEIGSCFEQGLECKGPGCECDRFLEFWNLVFMQFQRDEQGNRHDLPLKSVDTGMGLERIAAILQNKTSVFEIDAFQEISKQILKTAHIQRALEKLTPEERECTNIIADHMRLLCFTIADGIHFSNEGRGYVLRRILRRATRFVYKLCPTWAKTKSFLINVIPVVIKQNAEFFPELTQSASRITELIAAEEIKFNQTLESGLEKLHHFLDETKAQKSHILSGKYAFMLHDTFGFPIDLTYMLCKENHFEIDMQGYEDLMHEQKQKSRADAKFYKFFADSSPWTELNKAENQEDSNFNGYSLKSNYYKNNTNYFQKKLSFNQIIKIRQLKNKSFELVIKNTPFYPEGGGQISDRGFIEVINGKDVFNFEVLDVKKTPAHISHILRHEEWSDKESESFSTEKLKMIFHPSIELYCYVNLNFRIEVGRNHTTTHLLHKSLQVILGENVRQAGSLVKNDVLRFDFSHQSALTKHQIQEVENLVNQEILKNSLVCTHDNVPIEAAKNMGALAMFGEKYSDTVRVLQIDNFSLELCGGTHVNNTGEIGQFKILSEGSVTSGVRRIEGISGYYALEYTRTLEKTLQSSAQLLKCSVADLLPKITQAKNQIKSFEKQVLELEEKLAEAQIKSLLEKSEYVNGISIIKSYIPNISLKTLEILCSKITAKPDHIAVLATIISDKIHIISGMHTSVSREYKQLHLGKVILALCERLNGRGGGKADYAKGSGTALEKLNSEITELKLIEWF